MMRLRNRDTSRMQFGIFGSAQASTQDPSARKPAQGFRDYLDFNGEAEALGFRSSFLVEHHFTGWNQVSATLMLLPRSRCGPPPCGSARRSWCCPGTIRAYSPSRRRPSIWFPADASISASGRATATASSRASVFGREEAEPRFDESLEVMTRAWTTRARFSHRGPLWRFDDIVVEPPPAQQPHPPSGSRPPASLRSAGLPARLQPDPRPVACTEEIRRPHRAFSGRARAPAGFARRRRLRSPASSMSRNDQRRRRRRSAAPGRVHAHPRGLPGAGQPRGSHFSPMPTSPAGRRRTRSTARLTRSPIGSKRCSSRRRILPADDFRRQGAVTALSPARSCRPSRGPRKPASVPGEPSHA